MLRSANRQGFRRVRCLGAIYFLELRRLEVLERVFCAALKF